MTTKPIEVTDKDGNDCPAILVMCPDCGGSQFVVFIVEGHNHLQCVACDSSYCQAGHKHNCHQMERKGDAVNQR